MEIFSLNYLSLVKPCQVEPNRPPACYQNFRHIEKLHFFFLLNFLCLRPLPKIAINSKFLQAISTVKPVLNIFLGLAEFLANAAVGLKNIKILYTDRRIYTFEKVNELKLFSLEKLFNYWYLSLIFPVLAYS
jgi:hypothetical protein